MELRSGQSEATLAEVVVNELERGMNRESDPSEPARDDRDVFRAVQRGDTSTVLALIDADEELLDVATAAPCSCTAAFRWIGSEFFRSAAERGLAEGGMLLVVPRWLRARFSLR